MSARWPCPVAKARADRWRASSSDLIALWKNKNMSIGDFWSGDFEQGFDDDGAADADDDVDEST